MQTILNTLLKNNLDTVRSPSLSHRKPSYVCHFPTTKYDTPHLLNLTDDESVDQCVSCLSSKMTRKPFLHHTKKATDLLGLIHTDVCGLLRHVSRQGASYFMTFTDDYSRYGYVYLHIHEVFETFKVWGCEALVKRDTYAEFLEKNLISQEAIGRAVELKEIHNEDTSLSKNTSKIPNEVEGFEPPQGEIDLVRRSVRTHRAPERLYPKSNNWLDAMNAEIIKSGAWLIFLLMTVGSKWLFKKNTDIDGNVHTYKARLVAKSYTQTYGIDYEKMFSPVADIRAIKILIAIAAFYDYEIWQMDVKTAFLNIYLGEDIYIIQPEGFIDLKHFRKIDNSKRGNIPMQERLDLNKTQGASTRKEVKRMQNVPYASAVGSIIYPVRCTRTDVTLAQTSHFQRNPGEPH
nr:retrotransposon protein, putative, Ty1-copia subclass [Tanacetum cinerariifolium]